MDEFRAWATGLIRRLVTAPTARSEADARNEARRWLGVPEQAPVLEDAGGKTMPVDSSFEVRP